MEKLKLRFVTRLSPAKDVYYSYVCRGRRAASRRRLIIFATRDGARCAGGGVGVLAELVGRRPYCGVFDNGFHRGVGCVGGCCREVGKAEGILFGRRQRDPQRPWLRGVRGTYPLASGCPIVVIQSLDAATMSLFLSFLRPSHGTALYFAAKAAGSGVVLVRGGGGKDGRPRRPWRLSLFKGTAEALAKFHLSFSGVIWSPFGRGRRNWGMVVMQQSTLWRAPRAEPRT